MADTINIAVTSLLRRTNGDLGFYMLPLLRPVPIYFLVWEGTDSLLGLCVPSRITLLRHLRGLTMVT